ncbi:MAG TPA: hypothetical protein VIJ17_07300, partial [Pseudolabrys sp.]
RRRRHHRHRGRLAAARAGRAGGSGANGKDADNTVPLPPLGVVDAVLTAAAEIARAAPRRTCALPAPAPLYRRKYQRRRSRAQKCR